MQLGEKLPEIMSALVSATDIRTDVDSSEEGEVALEALKGLSSLLPTLLNRDTQGYTQPLLMRARFYTEKVDLSALCFFSLWMGLISKS